MADDELTFESAENIILQWEYPTSSSEETIFDGGNRDLIDQYLNAVDEIQRSLELAETTLTDIHQSKGKTAMRTAMDRLEHEFRNLLTAHACAIETDDPNSSSNKTTDSTSDERGLESRRRKTCVSCYRSANGICEIDLIPSDAIADLRSIAERMISAGYLRECVQVWLDVRKSCVDASLLLLGIESSVDDNVQWMEWGNLEPKIRWWIRAARVAIRIVFANEKKLCQQIFPFTIDDDFCFLEIVKDQMMQHLNFAGAINRTISPRSPEKLVKILELHDAMSDLLPNIEVVFHSMSSKLIRDEAGKILSELTEAAREIWSMFVNDVLNEPSKVLAPEGTIHPRTRYVMNYISLIITDYEQTMVELIVSKPEEMNITECVELEGRTPLGLHLIWIIMTLQSNLEGKSKQYKDPALGHLFMMNNLHYIVHKVKAETNLRVMIGDGYLRRLSGEYWQFATSYRSSTWANVMYFLREEGLRGNASVLGVSRSTVEDRFEKFNAAFREVQKTQAMWVIPDDKLRQEVRLMILELLIPAYTAFLDRLSNYLRSGRHPEPFVKYSVGDIQAAIFDLFQGTSASTTRNSLFTGVLKTPAKLSQLFYSSAGCLTVGKSGRRSRKTQ